MKRKINPVYVPCKGVCVICANPYTKGEIVYINIGMVHRSCLKEIIKHKNNNLTDEEIDFLIDTEIKEYQNYKKEKWRKEHIKNITKIKGEKK